MDFTQIEEYKVCTEDLIKNTAILLFAESKFGKTTFFHQLDNKERTLFLFTEPGYKFLDGVRKQEIKSYAEIKKAIKQLKRPEVKALFDTIVIDTIDLWYDAIAKHSASTFDKEFVDDVGYSKGYNRAATILLETLNEIVQEGYGLRLISHVQRKVDFKTQELGKFEPSMNSKAFGVVKKLVDLTVFGHIYSSGEEEKRVLFLRENANVYAGGRIKHLPNKIDFSVENFRKTLIDGIEKGKEENPDGYIAKEFKQEPVKEKISIEEVRESITASIKKIGGATNPYVTQIVTKNAGYLEDGTPRTLKDINHTKYIDLLEVIAIELEEKVNELGL